jgi:hypothetical protein
MHRIGDNESIFSIDKFFFIRRPTLLFEDLLQNELFPLLLLVENFFKKIFEEFSVMKSFLKSQH